MRNEKLELRKKERRERREEKIEKQKSRKMREKVQNKSVELEGVQEKR